MYCAQDSKDTTDNHHFALSQAHREGRLRITSVFLFALLMAICGQSVLGHGDAFGNSCSLSATPPSLASQFSRELVEATAGEQFIIRTIISNDCYKDEPYVAIIEVRNSDGVTEYIGLQSGVLTGLTGKTEIGVSWVPPHGDSYELRTFTISSLENPMILSPIMTTTVTIADNLGRAVITIPFDPSPSLQQSNFQPEFIKVIIGVNNTVLWTNGDNASHRLIGEQTIVSTKAVDFGKPIFLYPGYSTQHTFTETGLYEYRDQDRPWMRGFIQVYPHDALDAHLDLRLNGLKDVYKLGDPIQFTLDVSGYETGCGSLEVTVEKQMAPTSENMTEQHPFTWSWFAIFDCDVNPPFITINDHYPEEGPALIVPINGTGTYTATAKFESSISTYSETKDFSVT